MRPDVTSSNEIELRFAVMLINLQHLVQPPADFRQLCKAALDEKSLADLAGYRLDNSKLEQLATAAVRIRDANGGKLAGLTPFRLGLLANGTTDFLGAALTATTLRHGIDLHVVIGNYDQVLQEAINPASAIYAPPCDAVMLAVDHRGLPLQVQPGQDHRVQLQDAIDFLTDVHRARSRSARIASGQSLGSRSFLSSPWSRRWSGSANSRL